MFRNRWYDIQLRPDSVDRVWRALEENNNNDSTDSTSSNPDATTKTVVVRIPQYQLSEYIYQYKLGYGAKKTALEYLDISFTWNIVPDEDYIQSLGAVYYKDPSRYDTYNWGFFSRQLTNTDFELRRVISGYETKPFDPNGYVIVAKGKRPNPVSVGFEGGGSYTPINTIKIRQNLIWFEADPNNYTLQGNNSYELIGSMYFSDDTNTFNYTGTERRTLIAKVSKINTVADIIEFSLDNSVLYDKVNKKFTLDGIEMSGQEFINNYVNTQSWKYPSDISIDTASVETTFSGAPNLAFYVWSPRHLGGDGTTKFHTQFQKDGTSEDIWNYYGTGTTIVLETPESKGYQLYNPSTNTLTLYCPLDSLKDHAGLKVGDEIKIDIEPRLLENTYYYLTLANPTYEYIDYEITVQVGKSVGPEFWKIDDTPTGTGLALDNFSPTSPETRTPFINNIAISNFNKLNKYEFYNWDDQPKTGDITDLPSGGITSNEYFAWFKTPLKWEPYTIPVIKPPEPVYTSYNPVIKFGFSYETYPTADISDKGTVTGVDLGNNQYDITLKGHFWLPKLDYKNGTLAYPTDRPVNIGILVKSETDTNFKFLDNYKLDIFDKTGKLVASSTTKSSSTPIPYIDTLPTKEYTRELPAAEGGNGSDRCINFSTTFKLGANKNWQYLIYVTRYGGGNAIYADPTLKSNFLDYIYNPNFLITTPSLIVVWSDPTPKTTGFWYQIYDSWKEVTNVAGRISPYLTVKIYDGSGFPNNQVDKKYPIHYYLNYVFNTDKNFQFRTIVENYYNTITDNQKPSLQIKTPWGESTDIPAPKIGLPFGINQVPDDFKRINLYSYSNINGYTDAKEEKPKKLISSKTNPQNPITYVTTPFFGAQGGIMESGLCHVSVSESDWIIQGSAVWNVMTQINDGTVVTNGTIQVPYFYNGIPYAGRGWHYLPKEGRFLWFDKLYAEDDLNNCFPIGGTVDDYFSNKSSDIAYMVNNFITTYIPYQLFNLYFEYTNESPSNITMYMGGELPYKVSDRKTNIDDLIQNGKVKKIGTLGVSVGKKQKCEFIGLVGNQYLFFVADPILDFSSAGDNNFNIDSNKTIIKNNKLPYKLTYSDTKGIGTYSVIEIGNFGVSGTYNKGNNLLHQIKNLNDYKTDITNAIYSLKLGVGNNVFSDSINSTVVVSAKSGNGTMHSGIWENGVWNNGWRTDTTTREFRSVGQYYSYDKDRTWTMSIIGRESSVQYFNVGDVVAISNIVAIDINEVRKLLNSSFRIISKTLDSISVEFDTDFPIRRIEKDSSEHRILVTKNVWLNGVFLNGYFKGVWNNGLFSGFPMITKMDSSHWIDGIFNGGHFTAKKIRLTSSGTNIATAYKVDDKERMAISFTYNHNLEKDDVISMTYSTNFINNGVLGSTIVLDVPDQKTIVTGIGWRNELSDIKSITFITSISDGLVQNFEFHSNNVSTVSSLDTLLSERVFSYNSWMDINYSNKSAINIGRPQALINEYDKAYSENNLYGYPTNDVLSSKSTFRDSFSLTVRNYRLGKKYKIYKDYVGESSGFENYFDPTDTTQGDEAFRDLGWKWSKSPDKVITIPVISAVKSDGKLVFSIPDNNAYLGIISKDQDISVTGPVSVWNGNLSLIHI